MHKLHKNQQGIIHHLALIILAVVVVAGVGFTGYKVYQAKYGIKAKAYNWTEVTLNNSAGSRSRIKMYACKSAVGGSYVLRAYVANSTGYNATWEIDGRLDATIQNQHRLLSGSISPKATSNIHLGTFPISTIPILDVVINVTATHETFKNYYLFRSSGLSNC